MLLIIVVFFKDLIFLTILYLESLSKLDVDSSKIKRSGFDANTRKKEIFCIWPDDKLLLSIIASKLTSVLSSKRLNSLIKSINSLSSKFLLLPKSKFSLREPSIIRGLGPT